MSRVAALFCSVQIAGRRHAPPPGGSPPPPPPPPPPAQAAPTYDDPEATQPEFVPGSHASGASLVADFGVPLNGADTYTYAWMRDGADISGASGTTASTTTARTLVSGDVDKLVSLRFYATNSEGNSETVVIPGVLVSA